MNERPTLIIHTTYFAPEGEPDLDSERRPALDLGAKLYDLLTRPRNDRLAWGAGIPVRVAARPHLIDATGAQHAIIVPVLGRLAFVNERVRQLALGHVKRWSEGGARVVLALSREATAASENGIPEAFASLFAGKETSPRATVNEILRAAALELTGDKAYASRLYISHARGDQATTDSAAERIRAYVAAEANVGGFFDKATLMAGEALASQLDPQAEKGVFLVVRGDLYSSRSWCRRELLTAKRRLIPTLTVEVLSVGESNSAAYAGNGPTVVWDRRLEPPAAAAAVVTRAMVEAVRHLYFLKDSARIIEAAGLPPSTTRLSRPPELLDLAAVRAKTEAAVVLLHPDPPLPAFEREVLTESDKRLRLVTPTTAFAGAIGTSIRAPLDGWRVGLSLSEVKEEPEATDPDGITAGHLNDATTFLSRALIGVGASLAYGGDFREDGFTFPLAQLIRSYNETARRSPDFLHGYLAADGGSSEGTGPVAAYTSHNLAEMPEARRLAPPPRGTPRSPARAALYLSDMRRWMASDTQARVALGGPVAPKSHRPGGYAGRFPGIAEEVWWTLKAGKPLYLVGGFGGAAGLLVSAINGDDLPPELKDATWADKPERNAFVREYTDDPEMLTVAPPRDLETLGKNVREWMQSHLQASQETPGWNGLTAADNQTLFTTTDPLKIAALVLKGLLTLSARQAQGKLRVELVEGSVTRATDLELLVFPTFSDLQLDGAGAALDGVSGRAATLAHKTKIPVPAGSTSLGVQFLYAADLGSMAATMDDFPGAVENAARTTADVIHRHGFNRTGVVTFLGNVAPHLAGVVNPMVAGLRGAAGTTQIVWFESDPVQAALLASILGRNPGVALSRRVLPAPEVADARPRTRRTVVTLRQDQGALDIALLLDKANGLAPVVRSPFSDVERRLLAGDSKKRPTRAELEARGERIAELLFGPEAARAAVAGTQLVLVHEPSASGIPYETMTWTVGDRRLTPATEGGVVRHLLASGVAADRALSRPPRAGKLGVLVVIDPQENLKSASDEGEALVKLLKAGPFDVNPLRGRDATAEAVKNAISDPKIDVFHYCGHAFFRDDSPEGSGLECSDRALTLVDLQKITAGVPRLAFVNACEAAQLSDDRAKQVREPQAFAEFFLRGGVDAYLGAFWVVSDQAAATFAAKVYAELAAGRELGEAVVEGRRALQQAGSNDWANYVLYGDVGFRLVNTEAPRPSSDQLSAQPPPSSLRVDDRTVVAAWNLPAADAPDSFAVAVVEAETDAAVALDEPAQVVRRENRWAAHALVTWIVTLRLKGPIERDIELRPTSGERLRVSPAAGSTTPGEPPRTRGSAGLKPRGDLAELRTLLNQQPDRGQELLRAWQPSADPRELRAAIDDALARPPEDRTRAVWPFQELAPPLVDERALADFCERYRIDPYRLDPVSPAAARTTLFQTKEDWFNYATSPGAIAFTTGRDVRKPIWAEISDPEKALTYRVRDGEAEPTFKAALFSDNGNGLHASLAIAKQIRESKLPYAFHLGDVYYGGSKREFHEYFDQPLEEMFDRTELFMITGNHEMFAEGEWFQEMVRRKAKEHPERQRQSAEMFRLAGEGFQILGVDTMFVGWNSGRLRLHDRADRAVLEVVEAWLAEHPDDLTILLTTNQPWDRGSKRLTPLYESLRKTIAGRVDLWFWGNVHYGALFEPWRFADSGSPIRQLIGSCIGHGGYPFYTESKVGDLPDGLGCRWLETKSRFWPDPRIRPDVGANGWCRMELRRAGDTWKIDLTYIDWVGRERLQAKFARQDGKSIRFVEVKESDAKDVGALLSWQEIPPPEGPQG